MLTKLQEIDPGARVIVVSADVQDSSRDMAAAAGARAFVTKPVDREQILATVATALEGRV